MTSRGQTCLAVLLLAIVLPGCSTTSARERSGAIVEVTNWTDRPVSVWVELASQPFLTSTASDPEPGEPAFRAVDGPWEVPPQSVLRKPCSDWPEYSAWFESAPRDRSVSARVWVRFSGREELLGIITTQTTLLSMFSDGPPAVMCFVGARDGDLAMWAPTKGFGEGLFFRPSSVSLPQVATGPAPVIEPLPPEDGGR